MTEAPWFILVGGINGAGKSTFAQDSETIYGLCGAEGVEYINPDLVTKAILEVEPTLSTQEANLRAAVESQDRLMAMLAMGTTSVAIETVLSTDKYDEVIDEVVRRGYRFLFVYVVLGSVDEAISRVARRVRSGGHDVPETKIRKRWSLSLGKFPYFWGRADRAWVFFNGDRAERKPRVIAEKSPEGEKFHPDGLSFLLGP